MLVHSAHHHILHLKLAVALPTCPSLPELGSAMQLMQTDTVNLQYLVPGNWLTPPPTEETSTTLPEPLAFMPGSTAFTSHSEPSAFTCITQRGASGQTSPRQEVCLCTRLSMLQSAISMHLTAAQCACTTQPHTHTHMRAELHQHPVALNHSCFATLQSILCAGSADHMHNMHSNWKQGLGMLEKGSHLYHGKVLLVGIRLILLDCGTA